MRTVRVRISSEAAGSIALSPVVVQEMDVAALVDRIVGITGKDAVRVREVLRRGSIAIGTSRFRWDPLELGDAEVAAEMARLPDPEPSRPFTPAACTRVVLRGRPGSIELDRQVGTKKRFLRRRSFWDEVLESVQSADYETYSYADHADVYRTRVDDEMRKRIASAAGLLAYPGLRTRLSATYVDVLELYCARDQ